MYFLGIDYCDKFLKVCCSRQKPLISNCCLILLMSKFGVLSDYDGCGRKPGGGEESRVLLPALGSGGRVPLFLFKGDTLYFTVVLFDHCEILFQILKVTWKFTPFCWHFSHVVILSGSAKETGAGTSSWHSKHISKLAAVTTQDLRGFWVANFLLLCTAVADHYSYITVYLVLSCCSCPGMTPFTEMTLFFVDS